MNPSDYLEGYKLTTERSGNVLLMHQCGWSEIIPTDANLKEVMVMILTHVIDDECTTKK